MDYYISTLFLLPKAAAIFCYQRVCVPWIITLAHLFNYQTPQPSSITKGCAFHGLIHKHTCLITKRRSHLLLPKGVRSMDYYISTLFLLPKAAAIFCYQRVCVPWIITLAHLFNYQTPQPSSITKGCAFHGLIH